MTHTDTTTFPSDRYILSKTVVFQAGIGEKTYTYTAREWDSESQTNYFRYRQQDPRIGRFLSIDPIEYGNGINVYTYVKNNPTNYIDSFGVKIIVPNGSQGTDIAGLLVDLCPAASGRVTVLANGQIKLDKELCGWWERKKIHFEVSPSLGLWVWHPPKFGSTPNSCKCICDAANSNKNMNIATVPYGTKVGNDPVRGGLTASVPNNKGPGRGTYSSSNVYINSPGTNFWMTIFNNVTATLINYEPSRAQCLAHELCGHAVPDLAPGASSNDDDRQTKAIDIEIKIANEHPGWPIRVPYKDEKILAIGTK